MARKIVKISKEEEQMLKDLIAADIPSVHPEKVLSGEIKVEVDSVMPSSFAAGDTHINEAAEKKEEAQAQSGKQASPQRITSRKKKDPEEFGDLFLVKRVNTRKRQTYVNEEIYKRMQRYLSVIAPEFSITTYFDNILLKHLEDYEDVIAELYNESVKKPI